MRCTACNVTKASFGAVEFPCFASSWFKELPVQLCQCLCAPRGNWAAWTTIIIWSGLTEKLNLIIVCLGVNWATRGYSKCVQQTSPITGDAAALQLSCRLVHTAANGRHLEISQSSHLESLRSLEARWRMNNERIDNTPPHACKLRAGNAAAKKLRLLKCLPAYGAELCRVSYTLSDWTYLSKSWVKVVFLSQYVKRVKSDGSESIRDQTEVVSARSFQWCVEFKEELNFEFLYINPLSLSLYFFTGLWTTYTI